ncbi:MAG: hypothetical protein N838_27140 [Thiohalocapsa sp. PB-PSB1]|nr:MAG: hypothetical protein N838_27140 [Thiohalocapsa sp. PB-PSB1]
MASKLRTLRQPTFGLCVELANPEHAIPAGLEYTLEFGQQQAANATRGQSTLAKAANCACLG